MILGKENDRIERAKENGENRHLLGGIALAAQTIPPIPTHFSVAWSVVCRLSHSCTLLEPFDGFRCHLAGTLVGSNDTLCQMRSLAPRGRGDLGVKPPAKTCNCFRLTKKDDLWFTRWQHRLAMYYISGVNFDKRRPTWINVNSIKRFFLHISDKLLWSFITSDVRMHATTSI